MLFVSFVIASALALRLWRPGARWAERRRVDGERRCWGRWRSCGWLILGIRVAVAVRPLMSVRGLIVSELEREAQEPNTAGL